MAQSANPAARSALVTGGNRGIGQEVARMLAADGWDVVIGARDRKTGDATARRLREATGGRVRAVELDVADEASVSTAMQKLRDGAVTFTAIVNNAGVYRDADRERTIETNFFGPLRVTLAALPLVRDGGSITNVTSDLGSLSNLDVTHRVRLADRALTRDALVARMREYARGKDSWGTDPYGVSKAALNALTRIFAAELASRAIRVNAVSPGWVRTDMGGRNAPRSIEQGASSVVFGVTTTATGGVFRDGTALAP